MRAVLIALVFAIVGCGSDVVVDGDDDVYEPVPWTGPATTSAPTPQPEEPPSSPPPEPEEPTTPPPPEPEEPPASSPPPDPDGWPDGWSAREARMLELVNEMRRDGGECPSGYYPPRATLVMNAALRTAARLHSKDMADNDYFDHNGLDGSNPWSRIAAAGYDAIPVGENIAAGNAAAEDAFAQWKNSDGHCRNMMSSNATEIGVGYADGAGRYGAYWTQTFGAR